MVVLNICLLLFIFIPTWGNDPIWRSYFSDGLVQPPASRRFDLGEVQQLSQIGLSQQNKLWSCFHVSGKIAQDLQDVFPFRSRVIFQFSWWESGTHTIHAWNIYLHLVDFLCYMLVYHTCMIWGIVQLVLVRLTLRYGEVDVFFLVLRFDGFGGWRNSACFPMVGFQQLASPKTNSLPLEKPGGGNSNIFYFHPCLGKISILTI